MICIWMKVIRNHSDVIVKWMMMMMEETKKNLVSDHEKQELLPCAV